MLDDHLSAKIRGVQIVETLLRRACVHELKNGSGGRNMIQWRETSSWLMVGCLWGGMEIFGTIISDCMGTLLFLNIITLRKITSNSFLVLYQ